VLIFLLTAKTSSGIVTPVNLDRSQCVTRNPRWGGATGLAGAGRSEGSWCSRLPLGKVLIQPACESSLPTPVSNAIAVRGDETRRSLSSHLYSTRMYGNFRRPNHVELGTPSAKLVGQIMT